MITSEQLASLGGGEERQQAPVGTMSILSVGRGDIRITFDSEDPDEVDRARATVRDMLNRGYLIFVEVEGDLVRVSDFDPERNEYIVKVDKRSSPYKEQQKTESGKKKKKKAKKTTKRVPAKGTRGTAVAPTAGG